MKKAIRFLLLTVCCVAFMSATAQQRRPIDNEHPLWMIHIDVWNKADPQKIIDLIPENIRPFVCMNLSLSCQYDTNKKVFKMPQQAMRTYKSWATVCQHNRLWFTCQPASGGHGHFSDDDMVTYEYFFKNYPNFLGWNFAEQFWGFDAPGDLSSAKQKERIALFARLVEMSHEYGGFLTVSFCGNVYSYALTPVGMLKRDAELLEACRKYPEAILWLYKYTTTGCFYSTESVTFSPFISGLATNYGVRYDVCGWNGAMDVLVGEGKAKYPSAAGISTVLEQTAINGGAVWDGPELIWTEDFQNLSETTVNNYKRRNWGTFASFDNIWLDMFAKIVDGSISIPSREEVVGRTKVAIINDQKTGTDENMYVGWGDLYDGLYKQSDPANPGNGQYDNNHTYFKKTGRYATIPVCVELADELSKQIPLQVKKSARTRTWATQTRKVNQFNELYPEVSKGDLFVARQGNQLVTYTPYTYLNGRRTAQAIVPLAYNTCDSLGLTYGMLSSGFVREYADHIDLYLNNFRSDTTKLVTDRIVVYGAKSEPVVTTTNRVKAKSQTTMSWDADNQAMTIEVSHLGPVDMTISCEGNNQRDNVQPEATPLPMPKQPDEYFGTVIIEAEDMDYKGVKSLVTDPYGAYPSVVGHSGNGFVDMGANRTGSLRHQLTLSQAGHYDIYVRYTNGTRAGNLTLNVNGKAQTAACQTTTANEWKKVCFQDVELIEGTNDLRVNNAQALPIYIDQIIYSPAGTEAEKYLVTIKESDNGTVTADKAEAVEGDTVTLTVQPAYGYYLKELQLVNSVFYAMAKTIEIAEDATGDSEITFVMPDDNVTIRPVFASATLVYELDFNSMGTESIPYGWRCTQENNEVHEYPGSYGSGARTMAGFTGYQGSALYWRNVKAEYGRQTAIPFTLTEGDYKLTFAMAAWKGTPKYRVVIADAVTDAVLASSATFTAAPNANAISSANLSTAVERELSFTVGTDGNYVIRFETVGSGYNEYLLLKCAVDADIIADGIDPAPNVAAGTTTRSTAIYDLQGRSLPSAAKGRVVIVRDSESRMIKKYKK